MANRPTLTRDGDTKTVTCHLPGANIRDIDIEISENGQSALITNEPEPRTEARVEQLSVDLVLLDGESADEDSVEAQWHKTDEILTLRIRIIANMTSGISAPESPETFSTTDVIGEA